jgi:hypothetical protein
MTELSRKGENYLEVDLTLYYTNKRFEWTEFQAKVRPAAACDSPGLSGTPCQQETPMSILSPVCSPAKVDYFERHEPGEPDLPFAEKIVALASYYHSADTDFDNWIARLLDRLAEQVRFLGATHPDDFDDRHAAMLATVYERRPA